MIDPVSTGPVSPIAGRSAASVDARPTRASAAAVDPAPAVSPQARPAVPQLLDIVADLTRAGPPVDFARVAQVRRAIADGSYSIDLDALAKAIVQFGHKD